MMSDASGRDTGYCLAIVYPAGGPSRPGRFEKEDFYRVH